MSSNSSTSDGDGAVLTTAVSEPLDDGLQPLEDLSGVLENMDVLQALNESGTPSESKAIEVDGSVSPADTPAIAAATPSPSAQDSNGDGSLASELPSSISADALLHLESGNNGAATKLDGEASPNESDDQVPSSPHNDHSYPASVQPEVADDEVSSSETVIADEAKTIANDVAAVEALPESEAMSVDNTSSGDAAQIDNPPVLESCIEGAGSGDELQVCTAAGSGEAQSDAARIDGAGDSSERPQLSEQPQPTSELETAAVPVVPTSSAADLSVKMEVVEGDAGGGGGGSSSESSSKRMRSGRMCPCAQCGRLFLDAEHLERHVSSAHDDAGGRKQQQQLPPYPCPVCSREFTDRSNLRRHVANLHSSPPPQPDAASDGARAAKRLRASREPSQSAASAASGTESAAAAAAVRTASPRTAGGGSRFSCPHCPKAFAVESILKRHVASSHAPQQQPQQGHSSADSGKSKEPPAAAEARRGSKRKLQQQQQPADVGIERPHGCSECGHDLGSAAALRAHRMSCSGVPNKPHTCGQCGRKYLSAHTLRWHMLGHERRSAPPPPATAAATAYECRRCDRQLPDARSFISHMETHASEPAPYECSPAASDDDGGGVDADVADGAAAAASHLCDQCGRTFSRAAQLQLHMARHAAGEADGDDDDDDGSDEGAAAGASSGAPQPPRLCDKCGAQFHSAVSLDRHLKSAHGGGKEKGAVPASSAEGGRARGGQQPVSDGLHTCDKCDQRFPTAAKLHSHAAVHCAKLPSMAGVTVKQERGTGPKRPATSTAAAAAAAFEAARDDDGRHVCDACPAKFLTQRELKRHILTHGADTAIATGATQSPAAAASLSGGGKSRVEPKRGAVAVAAAPEPLSQAASRSPGKRKGPAAAVVGGEQPPERQHGCSSCGRRFPYLCSLRWHARVHTGRKAACHKCGREFDARHRLRAHLLQHAESRACAACDVRCDGVVQLWLHERRHHRQRNRGQSGGAAATAGDGRRRRLGMAHVAAEPAKSLQTPAATASRVAGRRWYKCARCSSRYRFAQALWRHVRESHRQELAAGNGGPAPGKKSPRNRQQQQPAVAGVGRQGWHWCVYCRRRYRQPGTLWRHTRMCHGDQLVVDGNRRRRQRTRRAALRVQATSLVAKLAAGASVAAQDAAASRSEAGSMGATASSAGAAAPPPSQLSAAEQSKLLISKDFKILPSRQARLKPPSWPVAADETAAPAGIVNGNRPAAAATSAPVSGRGSAAAAAAAKALTVGSATAKTLPSSSATPKAPTAPSTTPRAAAASSSTMKSSASSSATPKTPAASSATPKTPAASSATPKTPAASSATPKTSAASSATPKTSAASSATPKAATSSRPAAPGSSSSSGRGKEAGISGPQAESTSADAPLLSASGRPLRALVLRKTADASPPPPSTTSRSSALQTAPPAVTLTSPALASATLTRVLVPILPLLPSPSQPPVRPPSAPAGASTPAVVSAAAGHVGQQQSPRLPVGRLPTVTPFLPAFRQQAMCLWCDQTFARLSQLAEHACVHADELQRAVQESRA